MTTKGFLEIYPLYTKLYIRQVEISSELALDDVFMECGVCKRFESFRSQLPVGQRPESSSFGDTYLFFLSFKCNRCQVSMVIFFIQANYKHPWIRKIGQLPEPSIEIPKEIELELAEDAFLYKKGLISLNNGYGLAACGYFRRIIETHINSILKILYDTKQADSAPQEELELITQTMDRKNFTPKIELAYQILPPQ